MSVHWGKLERAAFREEISRLDAEKFPNVTRYMKNILFEASKCQNCYGSGEKRVGDDYRGYQWETCWVCDGTKVRE